LNTRTNDFPLMQYDTITASLFMQSVQREFMSWNTHVDVEYI